MKKTFAAGAAAGATGIVAAVPFLAQLAGAASGDESALVNRELPAPSQECVSALAARDARELSGMDSRFAAHKNALEARRSALEAAASITDETQRQEAVRAAHEAFRASMESAIGTPEDHEEEKEALKAACGDAFRMKAHGMGMHGGPVRMMMKFDLAEKLGMTREELKAEIDSGKTLEQIAQEKGIELPARPEKGMMRFGRGSAASSQETSAQ